jgi:hypothetical protein
MAWFCSGTTNTELIENLYSAGLIKNARVKEAMLGVSITRSPCRSNLDYSCLLSLKVCFSFDNANRQDSFETSCLPRSIEIIMLRLVHTLIRLKPSATVQQFPRLTCTGMPANI